MSNNGSTFPSSLLIVSPDSENANDANEAHEISIIVSTEHENKKPSKPKIIELQSHNYNNDEDVKIEEDSPRQSLNGHAENKHDFPRDIPTLGTSNKDFNIEMSISQSKKKIVLDTADESLKSEHILLETQDKGIGNTQGGNCNEEPSLPSRISMLFVSMNSLPNSKSMEPQLTKFVKSLQSKEEYMAVWEVILDGIISQLTSSLPKTKSFYFGHQFILGAFLIEAYPNALQHISSFFRVLGKQTPVSEAFHKDANNSVPNSTDEEKKSKLMAMSMIYFVHFYFFQLCVNQCNDLNDNASRRTMDEEKKNSILHAPCFLTTLLKILYNHCIEPVGVQRTNLSVLAMDLALFLIQETAIIIQDKTGRFDDNLKIFAMKALWQEIPVISDIVKRKNIWTKSASTTKRTADDIDNLTRTKCALRVVDDWNNLLQNTCRIHHQICCEKLNKRNCLKSSRWNKDIRISESNQKDRTSKSINETDLSPIECTTILHICYHLVGVEIPGSSLSSLKDYDSQQFIRLGGILQCLGSSPNKHFKNMYSIFKKSKQFHNNIYFHRIYSMSLVNSSKYLAVILDAINYATLLFHKNEKKHGEDKKLENEAVMETQRCISRALTAFLASKSQKLLIKYWEEQKLVTLKHDKSIDLWNGIINSCMRLLRSRSEFCVEMILTCLNRLWSDTNGLPLNFLKMDTKESSSQSNMFHELLDTLQELTVVDKMHLENIESSNKLHYSTSSFAPVTLDASIRTICTIIAGCIRHKPKELYPMFVKRMRIDSMITIEVLSLLVTTSLPDPVQTDSVDNSLCSSSAYLNQTIGSVLLKNLSNEHLHKRCNSCSLFLSMDIETVVPCLFQNFFIVKKSKCVSNKVASNLLCQILLRTKKVERVMKIIVKQLRKLEEKNKKNHLNNCYKVIGLWRRQILNSVDDYRFSEILVATGKSMFKSPSESSPLALFGSLIGNAMKDKNSNEMGERSTKKIVVALASIIKLALKELELTIEDDLLKRLSPLLMLRRIPSVFFKTLHKWMIDDNNDYAVETSILARLRHALSLRLDLEQIVLSSKKFHNELNDCRSQTKFSADERRLAAELTGRCLPFSVSFSKGRRAHLSQCSSFETIVAPTFCSFLHTITASGQTNSKFSNIKYAKEISAWTKRSKSALYALCNYVAIADDEDDTSGLLSSISFCLEVLSINEFDSMEKSIEEDIVQLQTGCINLFSLCLTSWAERNIERKAQLKGHQNSPVLVEEVNAKSIETEYLKEDEFQGRSRSFFKFLSDVFGILYCAVTDTKLPKWFESERAKYFNILFQYHPSFIPSSYHHVGRSPPFRVSTRTCILNAFVLTAQRCPMDNGELNFFANAISPRLVSWGSSGSIDDCHFHPLCIAGALQIIFICITRMKSVEALNGSFQDFDYIRKTHKWALETLKINPQIQYGDKYALETMRLSALKLMLAIATIDQQNMLDTNQSVEGRNNVLSPGEMAETLSILQGAANMDSNKKVRELAKHIMASLTMKNM